jgi:hypothetical protein
VSTPANVVWRHYSATGNEHGVTVVSADQEFGTHAISGGGYAGGSLSGTDEYANDAQGVAPLIGSYLSYDSGTDTTYFMAIFACPYGSTVRTHVWALLAEEA